MVNGDAVHVGAGAGMGAGAGVGAGVAEGAAADAGAGAATEGAGIRICHLYPDILNLYGDRGNTIALERRCAWRGIGCEVVELGAGQDADFEGFDLFFIGGGQDFDQHALMDDFGIGRAGSKAERLRAAIEADVPVLAICGGYQLLGEHYVGADGARLEFLGVLPAYTEAGEGRLIGNIVFSADALDGAPDVVGFENHAGRTWLREGATPLGHVRCGHGNNGEDGTEGVAYRKVIATYSHGPLLPKNPAIADELLCRALARRGLVPELEPVDDALETRAHDAAIAHVVHGT